MPDEEKIETSQIPSERETSPEMSEEAQEVMRIMTEAAISGAKVVLAGLWRGWESLCLIGPSLSRIATAHEKLASEAEILNQAYEHNVNQTHHSVKG